MSNPTAPTRKTPELAIKFYLGGRALPTDVVLLIFDKLDSFDEILLALTCKTLRERFSESLPPAPPACQGMPLDTWSSSPPSFKHPHGRKYSLGELLQGWTPLAEYRYYRGWPERFLKKSIYGDQPGTLEEKLLKERWAHEEDLAWHNCDWHNPAWKKLSGERWDWPSPYNRGSGWYPELDVRLESYRDELAPEVYENIKMRLKWGKFRAMEIMRYGHKNAAVTEGEDLLTLVLSHIYFGGQLERE